MLIGGFQHLAKFKSSVGPTFLRYKFFVKPQNGGSVDTKENLNS